MDNEKGKSKCLNMFKITANNRDIRGCPNFVRAIYSANDISD